MALTQTVIDWSRCPVLEGKPDTQGGAWVFRGTREPVTAILRNLSELSVTELSEEFSSVRCDQVTGLLDFITRSAEQCPEMSKRVLLDDNLPQKLRRLLSGHTVISTAYQGWAGTSKGALIAADQGLNCQQNMQGRKPALAVLSTNRNSLVVANAPRILTAINSAEPGRFTFVEIGR